jgi:hypothetical protein
MVKSNYACDNIFPGKKLMAFHVTLMGATEFAVFRVRINVGFFFHFMFLVATFMYSIMHFSCNVDVRTNSNSFHYCVIPAI